MTKKNIRILILLVFIVFVLSGWGLLLFTDQRSAVAQTSGEGLIRLHVLANSDSAADQQLKLKVRDAVVAYLTPQLSETATTAEARQVVMTHQQEILKVVCEVLRQNGVTYSAVMETGWFDFPLRSYGTLVLPAGKYEAVRILLGEAQGQNWWCVLFPPLCFVDVTGVAAVPASQGGKAGEQSRPEKPEIKWKLAELWQKREMR
jgi:stage II sporulation protein R